MSLWFPISCMVEKNSNATVIDCTKKKQGYEYQVSTINNGWTLSFT